MLTAGRRVKTSSIHWNTPPKYVSAITSFFGVIELDPCSNTDSIVKAKTELLHQGLEHDWTKYSTIYVNPPYGRHGSTTIYDWIQKGYITSKKANNELIYLIPVATNTRHWKDFVFKSDVICFLADTRLKFMINGSIDNKGASMACCLVYFGYRRDLFIQHFLKFGNCCLNLKGEEY